MSTRTVGLSTRTVGLGRSALLLAVVAATFSVRADIKWVGAYRNLNADWSASGNWEGGVVPTGGETAVIDRKDSQFRMLGLTPPLDFTGSIKVLADTSGWDTWIASRVDLTVLEGATWNVTGNGYVYATEGIADRIASSFDGTIVIPKGRSFVAPSTLKASVKFLGDGRLTVSTSDHLKRLGGFTGTLVWAGETPFSVSDTALLQGRTVELPDGATMTCAKRMLSANAAIEMKDWNADPDAWTMGGRTDATSAKYDLDQRPPHANPDGSLALVNDAGQVHVAAYTGRKFQWYDTWGVSFRHTPALPARSKFTEKGAGHEWSGSFGVYISTNTTCAGSNYIYPLRTGGGFRIYYWDSPHIYTYRNSDGYLSPASQSDLNQIGSVNMHEPMDVTVTCQDGIMTILLRQGDKHFAMSYNFNIQYVRSAIPDGFYFCFGASSDFWNDDAANVPWSTHTISNFKGWYRAREAGRWETDSRFYPFTDDNTDARIYSDDTTYTSNPWEADGSFRLASYGMATRNVLISKATLDQAKPHLVNFDLVYGQGTDGQNTEYTKFGFHKNPGGDGISSWIYGWDGKKNNILQQNWSGYAFPLFVSTYWYGGSYRYFCAVEWDWDESASGNFSNATMIKNTTQKTCLLYDGHAGLHYLQRNSSSYAVSQWVPDSAIETRWTSAGYGLHFVASHGNSWGRVDTILKNLSVKTLNDNQNAYFAGGVGVAAGATATFSADAQFASSATETAEIEAATLADGSTLNLATGVAGSKFVLDGVKVNGTGATLNAATPVSLAGAVEYTGTVPAMGLTLSGSVTVKDDALTFVVPDSWKSYKGGTVTLLKGTAGATLPDSYRLVTKSGRDLTKKADFKVVDGEVRANWTRGLFMVLR